MTAAQPRGGDPDIATVAGLFADRARARVLMALSDGRALPASVLAAEAAVTPQAASAQLSRPAGAGLLTVEQSGRHRYYRLATGHVTAVLEALAVLTAFTGAGWITRAPGQRAVRVTPAGQQALSDRLGLDV